MDYGGVEVECLFANILPELEHHLTGIFIGQTSSQGFGGFCRSASGPLGGAADRSLGMLGWSTERTRPKIPYPPGHYLGKQDLLEGEGYRSQRGFEEKGRPALGRGVVPVPRHALLQNRWVSWKGYRDSLDL